jgi:hypothetical protein
MVTETLATPLVASYASPRSQSSAPAASSAALTRTAWIGFSLVLL